MSLTARRWLYSSFIAAFFLITTLVVSYANGYMINWTKGRLIKTGTFVFKTQPESARIYLNGQLQTEYLRLGQKKNILTPAKIKNLLPGEYRVRFELDGYFPWEKKLVIKSGESTYAETVQLFPNTKLTTLNNEEADQLMLDSDNSVLSWRTSNKISLYDLKNNRPQLDVFGKADSYRLEDNADHLLINDSVYNNNLAVPILSVSKLIGAEAKNIQFIQGQDKIAFSLKGSIQSIDLSNQKITPLLESSSTQIINFNAHGNQLEVVSASSSRYFWQFYRDGALVRSLELPISNYKFKWLNNEWVALFDTDHELVYLVKANTDNSQIKTIKHCQQVSYINNSDFLCTNQYEIFTYNFDSEDSKLLDRLSEPVLSAYWYKTNNYIVYLTKEAVFTLELDQRDFRNKTKIIDITTVDSVYDRDSSLLYISGIFKGQQGVVVLSL